MHALPQIALPTSAVGAVILTTAHHYRCELPAPEHVFPDHLGLETIDAGLRSAGFKHANILKPENFRPLDVYADAHSIVRRFRNAGAAESGSIIGISTTSEEYPIFEALSFLLRNAFPSATIIAGGAHFARQRIDDAFDTVEAALVYGLADAVQVGHAGAFIELIVKHRGEFREVEGPGWFYLDRHTGRVMGHGRGHYPPVDELPMIIRAEQNVAHTMIGDQCLNGCDFCFLSGRLPPRIPGDIVEASLRNAFGQGVNRLFMTDSNPLASEQRGFYAQLFERLADCGSVIKSVYLDSAELTGDIDVVVKHVLANGYWHFFVGRDSVLESQSHMLGTKYRGKLKDQRMLEAERAGLKNFISAMNRLQRDSKDYRTQRLKLSYIVTPFETRESAFAMYDDMLEFLDLSNDVMHVSVSVQTLMPYPGTEIRRRFKDAIDLENLTFGLDILGGLAPWKQDLGPGLNFMRSIYDLPQHEGSDAFLKNFLRMINLHFGR